MIKPIIKKGKKHLLMGKVKWDKENTQPSTLRDEQITTKTNRTKIVTRVILIAVGGFAVVLTVLMINLYRNAINLKNSLSAYATQIQNQQVHEATNQLEIATRDLGKLELSYSNLKYFGSFPMINNYYKDGASALSAFENILEAARIVTNNLVVSGEVPANDSLQDMSLEKYNFILKSAPKIASESAVLLPELVIAREKLEEINPDDYPTRILGKDLRLHITDLLGSLDNGILFLSSGIELIDKIPQIAAFDGERKYLIIFQNNKELRPTGGFITAYTIADVNSGNIRTTDSSDIYDLDEKYEPTVSAPKPIIENLQGPYLEIEKLRLRDLNWNPDFPTSMSTLLQELEKVGINNIDGVIAIDTQVLVDVIDVIGEINVPGYGGYSNNIVELCDCEQIIYELEHFADREGPIVWSENEPGKIVEAPENYEDRKKIIGPMMNTIVENIFGLRQSKYLALFNALIGSVQQKHILLYMTNELEQRALEEFGASGKIVQVEGGDYLYVNDANLGGKKANLYVTHQVDQLLETDEKGSLIKTVELTYRNPKPQNNWLNTVLPNYVRVYVPEGSELVEFNGLDYQDDTYDELGKTVFAGRLTVRPMGVTKVTLKYKLPFDVNNRYNLYLQKQPGKGSPKYTLKFRDMYKEFLLDTDKKVTLNLD